MADTVKCIGRSPTDVVPVIYGNDDAMARGIAAQGRRAGAQPYDLVQPIATRLDGRIIYKEYLT
jgi:hypothetical protein